ncbi:MAG: hypothetical protein FWC54_04145 [Actinomycetia bacterium]|nr:hypothetical protein [Actinomycetes bacterium]
MRRPTIERWLRRELIRLSGLDSFNLRKLAAHAQKDAPRLIEPLLLYAYATGCLDRLLDCIWREDVRDSYQTAIGILSGKDLSAIALQKQDADKLPREYQKFLNSYRTAYLKPENDRESKLLRWKRSRALQQEKGIGTSEIYHALGLNAGNVNAYLKHSDLGKVSLEHATAIMKYLYQC